MLVSEIADIAKSIRRDLTKKVVAAAVPECDYNWDSHTLESFAAYLSDLKDGSPDVFAPLESRFQFIADIKSEPKNRLLVLEYMEKNGFLPKDAEEKERLLKCKITAQVAAYAASVLDEPRMATVLKMSIINAKNGTGYKSYEIELFSKVPDDAVRTHLPDLVGKLKAYVQNTEHCAECAEPLEFHRGDTQVLILKMDDRPVDVEVLTKDATGFETIAQSPSINLAVMLDAGNRRISVKHRTGKKARAIANIFCDEVLGAESYRFVGEIAYNLDYFAKHSETVIGGTSGGVISSVRVVELYVELPSGKNSRRTYYELENDLYEAIRDELASKKHGGSDQGGSVFPKGTKVRRVKLRVKYDTATKPGLEKTFTLTPTTEDGFKDAPRSVSDTLFALLEKKGIATRRRMPDGVSAGGTDSAGA